MHIHRSLALSLSLLGAGCASGVFAEDEESEPDFPNAALEWRALRWMDENQQIPAGAWLNALQARQALIAAKAMFLGGVVPTGWVERGPFNVSGRSRTIAIDPRNTAVLWSGGVSGGLWKSTDRGATWTEVSDWWTNLSIASLTLDPSNPDVMYVGTGEGFFNINVARGVNRSAVRGAGIFKSIDGGVTWSQLPATTGFDYVQRVAVSPTNPAIVLASVRQGGVWRSADGGASWTQVLTAYSSDQVLFNPNDGTKALAHTVDSTLAVHNVYWSSDAGATWTPAATGLVNLAGYDARCEMCFAASVPGVVYASTGLNGGKVWRSADNGHNWVLRTGASTTGVTWYFNGFWVDPTNDNVQVATGLHVWRSTDGGVTFSQITNGYIMTTDPHLDVHAVAADPDYNGGTRRRVYVTTDGGLHVADDILAAGQNTGWRDLDNGMRSTQFYGAAGVAATNLLVGGAQDNGTQRLIGTATNSTMTFGGDGGQVVIDPTNNNYVFGEYVWCQVHRSSNGGLSAAFVYNNITEITATQANFVAPIALDPLVSTRMYAGATQLWRTTNNRASTVSWTAVKPGVVSFISAIAVAPTNSDIVWVAHDDGQLYKTGNGTTAAPSWSTVDDNVGTDPLPNRYITRIAIDPTNSNTVWVTLGGFASGNVRVTGDGGATWSDASGVPGSRLPDVPVNCVLLHPDNPSIVYVATEIGIFASEDAGQHWAASNEGPSNSPVEQLTFVQGSRTILAATLGRGLWTCDVHLPAATSFGSACAGQPNPPTFGVDPLAAARIGQTMGWVGAQALPNVLALFVLGFSNTSWSQGALPYDLTPFGMPGCPLLVRPDFTVSSLTSASGDVRFNLPLPNNTAFLGVVVYGQLATADQALNAAGFAVSAGVRVVIGQ